MKLVLHALRVIGAIVDVGGDTVGTLSVCDDKMMDNLSEIFEEVAETTRKNKPKGEPPKLF